MSQKTSSVPDRLTRIKWTEIKKLWARNYPAWSLIAAVLGGFALGWLAHAENIVPAIGQFVLTALACGLALAAYDDFVQRRDEQRLRADLHCQMNGRSNAAAIRAIDALRAKGWLDLLKEPLANQLQWAGAALEEVDLSKRDLVRPNLSGATLWNASFSGCHLVGADFTGAQMNMTNLSEANLWYAKLDGANLVSANLIDADIRYASLRDAKLNSAKLHGTMLVCSDLSGANLTNAGFYNAVLVDASLENAVLAHAMFNEKTRLPDESWWTPDTDMKRFTDPAHPQFWRAMDPLSPASRE
jgi:uncharacterized protein YjbI with pentapeptide repeats